MREQKYLFGIKAILKYLGNISYDTFKRWRRKAPLRMLKSSKHGRVMTTPEWLDEWLIQVHLDGVIK